MRQDMDRGAAEGLPLVAEGNRGMWKLLRQANNESDNFCFERQLKSAAGQAPACSGWRGVRQDMDRRAAELLPLVAEGNKGMWMLFRQANNESDNYCSERQLKSAAGRHLRGGGVVASSVRHDRRLRS
ncbi:MAG: hypothetical protein Fues2KO_16960 [Fuerstiella sp.]